MSPRIVEKYLGAINYVTAPKCLEICTLTVYESNWFGWRMGRELFFKSQMCSEHTCIGLWHSQKLWPGMYLREQDRWLTTTQKL